MAESPKPIPDSTPPPELQPLLLQCLDTPAAERPEVLVDYNRVPPAHPDGWPAIRPNERGLSRFVYGYMIDTVRGVSEHVTIGSAARKGKDLSSWFVLCREA